MSDDHDAFARVLGNAGKAESEPCDCDKCGESRRLRDDVKRLEGIIKQAALLLDEGDPPKVLAELEDDLRDARLDGDAANVAELAATLRRVQALLKA